MVLCLRYQTIDWNWTVVNIHTHTSPWGVWITVRLMQETKHGHFVHVCPYKLTTGRILLVNVQTELVHYDWYSSSEVGFSLSKAIVFGTDHMWKVISRLLLNMDVFITNLCLVSKLRFGFQATFIEWFNKGLVVLFLKENKMEKKNLDSFLIHKM